MAAPPSPDQSLASMATSMGLGVPQEVRAALVDAVQDFLSHTPSPDDPLAFIAEKLHPTAAAPSVSLLDAASRGGDAGGAARSTAVLEELLRELEEDEDGEVIDDEEEGGEEGGAGKGAGDGSGKGEGEGEGAAAAAGDSKEEGGADGAVGEKEEGEEEEDDDDDDSDEDEEVKLVLCVRTDLKMQKGKMCAQVSAQVRGSSYVWRRSETGERALGWRVLSSRGAQPRLKGLSHLSVKSHLNALTHAAHPHTHCPNTHYCPLHPTPTTTHSTQCGHATLGIYKHNLRLACGWESLPEVAEVAEAATDEAEAATASAEGKKDKEDQAEVQAKTTVAAAAANGNDGDDKEEGSDMDMDMDPAAQHAAMLKRWEWCGQPKIALKVREM